MGTAWLLMCVALMPITQNWISVALGIPAMVLAYLDVLKADQRCVEKFGDACRRYMERMPHKTLGWYPTTEWQTNRRI